MARKKNTNHTQRTTSDYGLVKACAFWGLVIAGIAALLSFIFAILAKFGITFSALRNVINICSTISQVAIAIAAIVAGYHYTRGRSAVWRAFYWVAVILFVLGLVGVNIYHF